MSEAPWRLASPLLGTSPPSLRSRAANVEGFTERSDQRGRLGERGGALEAELARFVADRLKNRTSAGGAELSEDQLRALEALGYVD